MRAVLLDTCAVIWLANGMQMRDTALSAIRAAGRAHGIYVSPVSAWEIGLLSCGRQDATDRLEFRPDPKTWFARLMAGPGFKSAAITPDIAIESWFLPGEPHADPGDRLIMATARHLDIPVVTRDRSILRYGRAGHIGAIGC